MKIRSALLAAVTAITLTATLAAGTATAAVTPGPARPVVAAERADTYQLRFHNHYKSTVWVAVMYRDVNRCRDYGGYATEGWWGISWGQDLHILNTQYRYVYFYAFSEDQAKVWQSTSTPFTRVRRGPTFTSCWTIDQDDTWQQVRPRLIDLGAAPGVHTYDLWAT